MSIEKTEAFYENPASHFGGTIYLSDFSTSYSGSRNIAGRIVSDWQFDKHCKKNEEARSQRTEEEKEWRD